MQSYRGLNLIALFAFTALNTAFLTSYYHIPSSETASWFYASALPFTAGNIILLGAFVALRISLGRWRGRVKQLERSYQSLLMMSEDREVEARILEAISDVSVQFLDKMSLPPLLDRISDAIHSILHVDITIIEVLPDSGEDTMRFLRGTTNLSLSKELYDEVLLTGKSLLVNNLSRYPQYMQLHQQGIRSIVVAPLTLHSRTIGLIGAGTKTLRGFTSRDLRQLHSFSSHAALLIETTQLLSAVGRLSLRENCPAVGDLRHLKEHLSLERRLQEHEMDVARRIQEGLLPRNLPTVENVLIEGSSVPAKEVGGDYYDVVDLGEGRWGIAIADVSGKGVPASLVMVMTRTLLHAISRTSDSPREILSRINIDLFEGTDPSVFVSMLYGIWDSHKLTFTYSNAGHEPPVLSRGGQIVRLDGGGVALGAIPYLDDILEDRCIALHGGEALFLFTDGATEASNAGRKQFGIDRLERAFHNAVTTGAGGVIPVVLDEIKAFTEDSPQHDDITLVCINVVPQPVLEGC